MRRGQGLLLLELRKRHWPTCPWQKVFGPKVVMLTSQPSVDELSMLTFCSSHIGWKSVLKPEYMQSVVLAVSTGNERW